MKPTRDLVPLTPAVEHWLGLTVYGGLARTVADSALLLEVLADRGEYRDAAVAAAPGKLRIAVSQKIPRGLIAGVSQDQRRALEQTRELLDELGHEVSERHPAYGNASLEFVQTWLRGIYEDSLTVPDPDQLESTTKGMARAGKLLVSERRAARLRQKRAATTARILGFWDQVDVLVTPGLASTAIPAEGGYGRSAMAAFNVAGRFTPWTAIFNLTGQPAITIPAGFGADGLPLSVQLVGRPGEEALLYGLAGQVERARPWADRRPPL
jgi:amidase